MKQTRFLTARFKIHAQNGQPQWKCNSYLIMPESIYLPPFSLNQWLRIIISKRQNSSGTLIPLCSTDQHISEVKFANTDIYHRRVNGYDNHINWGGGGGRGNSDKNQETSPGNIRPLYESDREWNCMSRETKEFSAMTWFHILHSKGTTSNNR